MSDSEAATFRAELRKTTANVGVMIEACRINGQISSGCHLVMAREELFAALKSFNPKVDERELSFNLDESASSDSKF